MSQTINPNQIRPYGTSGQLIGTVGGQTVPMTVVAGSGISVTLVGNQIVISTSTGLTIVSFSGGQIVELGQSVVSPTFTASYTGTPTSASISNTDGNNSPQSLTSPFTAVSLIGTFAKASISSTTFTLTATNGSTSPTATQQIAWEPRIFGGVGNNGATSAVTASGTTAILSTTDVLPSAHLGAEVVNEVFGPYTPNNQYFYLLLTGGSHTFVDAASGLTIPFNAPLSVSFDNQFGVSVSMYLYQSSYASGPGITTNIRIAS